MIPAQGKKEALEHFLSEFKNLDVLPAEEKEVLIVVTDTADKNEEELLLEKLKANELLGHITMVFGSDPEKIKN